MWIPLAWLLAAQAAVAVPAPDSPVRGGVPAGQAAAEPVPLRLSEAVERGLQQNLGVLLADQGVRHAEGERWEARSDLLPHLTGRVSGVRQKINLEAFGFTGLAGIPTLIGPFNVYDARVAATERLLDFGALYKERSEQQHVEAARHTYQDTRDLVILVCGSLYLEAVSDESRIEAARAQLATAQALLELASDRKRSGLAPALDVLRADVESKARQQQLIVVENRFARAKLALGRAIGLPPGQDIVLVDRLDEMPPAPVALDQALVAAYANRSDWQAAQAEVRAAQESRRSAKAEALPSVELNADYGVIGQSFSGAPATYSYGATVRVPVLQGGKVHGKVLKADADLGIAQARLGDLQSRIDFEVRTSSLDLTAAARRVEVAKEALSVAGQQIEQAKDRFTAGVANNIDVVQAQEALAASHESYIEALYDQSLARAALAHAVGAVEASYHEFVKSPRSE
jgi:outer membrane protein TolC